MRKPALLPLLIWLSILLLLLLPALLLNASEEAPLWVSVLISLLMLAFATHAVVGFIALLRQRKKK